MVERRQLPSQIKRIELARRAGGRPVVRYQLTVDVGIVDGKRKQLRKRYATERDARDALDEIRGEVAKGTYVHPSALTVEEACANWLMSRHGIKPKTKSADRRLWRTVVREDWAVVTCCDHLGRGGIIVGVRRGRPRKDLGALSL